MAESSDFDGDYPRQIQFSFHEDEVWVKVIAKRDGIGCSFKLKEGQAAMLVDQLDQWISGDYEFSEKAIQSGRRELI